MGISINIEIPRRSFTIGGGRRYGHSVQYVRLAWREDPCLRIFGAYM